MGRPEKPIDPDNGPIADFAARLRSLRHEVGSPPYRSLSQRTQYSPVTLAEAARGDRLPTWPVVAGFVGACHDFAAGAQNVSTEMRPAADDTKKLRLDAWQARWEAARSASETWGESDDGSSGNDGPVTAPGSHMGPPVLRPPGVLRGGIWTHPRPTVFPTSNVLIIDDHDLVAMALALCLRSEGLHAQRHAARSRDGILTAVATLVPGVVLLDLDLGRGPDGLLIDGTTLVAPLCCNGWRVIVLSATTDEPRIGHALDAGAVACVSKTAELPVLITAIRRAEQGLEVMRPERREYFIAQYRRQQEQARVVDRRLGQLTDRERAVLERLGRGRRGQAIAEEFGVSLATTRTQIRAVLHKLGVNGQLEAVALLNEHRRMAQGDGGAVLGGVIWDHT